VWRRGLATRRDLRDARVRTCAAETPDVSTTVEQVVSDDERVAVLRVVHGTIRNDLDAFGIKANGQEVTFPVANIFTVRNGQITHWDVADTGPLMRAAAVGMR
jgi:predicted ester cyclase